MKLVQSKRRLENNTCFKIKQDFILETYLTCLDLGLNLDLNVVIKENIGYGYIVSCLFQNFFSKKKFLILKLKERHSRPSL